ncbi:MAG: hypothetical protein HY721_28865 [Planctomycetes bacterium]|nr:hypothetical protein [Planctomycetota bacterium]
MRRVTTLVRQAALCACLAGSLPPGGSKLYSQATDPTTGQILSSQWLILGPFSNPFGCAGTADDYYRNHIGPVHHIACEAPAEGDEIVGYDPGDPSVGSTGYVGPTLGAGEPYWRGFDDSGFGVPRINLDADVNGDQTDVMSWLATYIEYLGAQPTFVELCVGSDDGVQVWVDKVLVHNNNSACRPDGVCDDTVPALITPGVHVIKMGIWERAGGWGGSLGLRQDGLPITDDAGAWPDWTFLGREGVVALGACEPEDFTEFVAPVQGLNCVRRGDGGRDLSWSNPPSADPAVPISVQVDGVEIATLPGTATSYTVAAANVPAGRHFFCLVNSSGIPGCTTCLFTDGGGLINTGAWLALGPFSNPFACTNNNAAILGNHIAPSHIRDQYPVAGDPVPYDPGPAVSTGYHPAAPTDLNGDPIWRNFDDGSDNGDQDMDRDVAGGLDVHMTWLLTYVEYLGATDVQVQLCVGSDDGVQVWDNCDVAHNNNACRGRGVCQDRVDHTITPGVHALRMGVWENGGGWGGSLGLIDAVSQLPITDDPDVWPDWRFHGRQRPAGFTPPECSLCIPEPVQITSCEFGKVGLSTGIVVTWINPATIDPAVATQVLVNGAPVMTVPSDATRAGIPKALLPPAPAIYTIEIIHCGGVGAICSPNKTDPAGYINSTRWLVVGPFANPFGCNGNNDSILGNHLAPSFIGCEYPSSADAPETDANEVAYDPADPEQVSTGYVGPPNANNLPFWRLFNDGSDDADQNLDADVAGNQTDVMSWMATYVEVVGAPLEVELCVGSDDGVQVWDNATLVHNNNACRARGLCQDRPRATLDVGVHRLAAAAWERQGGWGLSLGLVDAVTAEPILDDGSRDDIIFHGSNRPKPVTDFPCERPSRPVTDLTCAPNQAGGVDVSWTPAEDQDPQREIEISLNGAPVGTVPATATSFTVPPPIPGGAVQICVDNGAIRPACCAFLNGDEVYINCGGPEFLDLLGRVWLEDTLANPSPFLTGPNAFTADFGNPGGVNLNADPVVAGEQFPAEIFPQERWNDGLIEYTIPGLPMGDYEVALLFMEGCCSDGCEDIPDPALSAGGCRVFDILINDELVDDQFSQNVVASQTAGTVPGVPSNYVAIARVYDVSDVTSIKIRIEDLGPGNPPENASVKGICIRPSGPREICDNRLDDDSDGKTDCDDPSCAAFPACQKKGFHRGDADDNGVLQLTDAIRVLGFLFLGGVQPGCMDAADADGNNNLQLTDAIRILGYLFLGGVPPEIPGPPPNDCGPDNDGVSLGCETYVNC